MFEFILNIPASIYIFTSRRTPQTEFLFSISSKDGERNPSKNVASIQVKQHLLLTLCNNPVLHIFTSLRLFLVNMLFIQLYIPIVFHFSICNNDVINDNSKITLKRP